MRSHLVFVLLAGVALTACSAATAPSTQRGEPVLLRAHRSYDGAPPVIPHLVGDLGRGDCLNCHLKGDSSDDGQFAPKTPHPELTNCRQCHVERTTEAEFVASDFKGGVYATGTRQHAESPWRIPHPLTMRERCSVCHTGENVPESVRTTHPERTNCVQCHLPAHDGWPGPRPGVQRAVEPR